MGELLTVTVEFDAKSAQEELDKMHARLDPRDLDPRLAKDALDEFRRSYQAQQDPDGNPWLGESSAYLREKGKRWGGKPMLHASEALWNSLGYTEEGDIGSINDPGYAAYVNAEREFLGVGEEWMARADVQLLEYVDLGEWSPP